MPIEIGSFEAKAQLSRLLREVQRGQRFTITSRGRPVAALVPCAETGAADVLSAIEGMRSLAKVRGVSAESVSQWVSEGRR
jgi:prevent-host-death family protein